MIFISFTVYSFIMFYILWVCWRCIRWRTWMKRFQDIFQWCFHGCLAIPRMWPLPVHATSFQLRLWTSSESTAIWGESPWQHLWGISGGCKEWLTHWPSLTSLCLCHHHFFFQCLPFYAFACYNQPILPGSVQPEVFPEMTRSDPAFVGRPSFEASSFPALAQRDVFFLGVKDEPLKRSKRVPEFHSFVAFFPLECWASDMGHGLWFSFLEARAFLEILREKRPELLRRVFVSRILKGRIYDTANHTPDWCSRTASHTMFQLGGGVYPRKSFSCSLACMIGHVFCICTSSAFI